MKFKPLHDNILIQRDETATMTPSGIFLPEISKEKSRTGTVVAVGSGVLNTSTGQLDSLSVKAGDRVMFTAFAGTEVTINEEKFLIMKEEEIFAILE